MDKQLKLLILGANTETIPLIKTAQNMGVFVFVTDNNPNSPAKKYADQAITIDGTDTDNLVLFCKNTKIDGVLVGVADKLVQTYAKVCNILNIPSYINQSSAAILSNKRIFDNYCNKYGLLSIPKISLPVKDTNVYKNGILLKPSDGCSGRGIYVAYSLTELEKYTEISAKHSVSGDVLSEQCMTGDEIFAYFSIVDGEVYLSAVADKLTNKSQGITGKVILNSIYPSKYTNSFYNTQYKNISNLIKSLNINTGIFMISAFVDNDKFYLYDPGCRLQGEAPDVVLNHLFKFNHNKMLISYALNKSWVRPQNLSNMYQLTNNYAATVWLLAKSGTISQIIGLDDIINQFGVYHYLQRLRPGDTITEEMIKTEAQVVARIYTSATSYDKLQSNILSIRKHVKVISHDKQDLLIYE